MLIFDKSKFFATMKITTDEQGKRFFVMHEDEMHRCITWVIMNCLRIEPTPEQLIDIAGDLYEMLREEAEAEGDMLKHKLIYNKKDRTIGRVVPFE